MADVMSLLTGGICGVIGGFLTTLSAWFLVDEWRWRRVRRRICGVANALLGLVGGLAFVGLALLAWAAVFAP
jgi:fluoride ion exporter CrcB/FEX